MKEETPSNKYLSVTRTGAGYRYFRDRSNGDDITVYEHQLVMLLEHDPQEVFSDEIDVHHCAPGKDGRSVNVPSFDNIEILQLREVQEHRTWNLERVHA